MKADSARRAEEEVLRKSERNETFAERREEVAAEDIFVCSVVTGGGEPRKDWRMR